MTAMDERNPRASVGQPRPGQSESTVHSEATAFLLHAALLASERRAATLAELAGVTSNTRDPLVLAQRAVDLVKQATNADGAFVYRWDGGAERMVLRVATEGRQRQFIDTISLRLGEGLTGWAALMRRSVTLDDKPLEDPRFAHFPELMESEFRSVLAVPIMIAGGEVSGVFSIYSEARGSFGKDEVSLVEEVASLLASAMAQADTVERLERQADVARLFQDLRHDSFVDESAIAGALVERIRVLLRCELSVIELLGSDPMDNAKNFAVSAPVRVDNAIPRKVDGQLMSREAVTILLEGRTAGHAKIVRALAVPDGPPLALLSCYRTASFSAEDQAVLDLISTQVGLALAASSSQQLTRALLTELRSTSDGEWAIRQLTKGGWKGRGYYLPVVIQIAGTGPSPQVAGEQARRLLREALEPMEAFIITSDSTSLGILIPVDGENRRLPDSVDHGLRDFARELSTTIAVGVGRPVSASDRDVHLAIRDAWTASLWADLRSSAIAAVYHDDIRTVTGVLNIVDEMGTPLRRLIAGFRDVVSYDREHGTDLIKTLDVFLTNRGSTSQTATSLFVHRNTLRQRLQRIELITGLSLEGIEDWLVAAMAIRLTTNRVAQPTAQLESPDFQPKNKSDENDSRNE
jgi:GAF domain-containing protein